MRLVVFVLAVCALVATMVHSPAMAAGARAPAIDIRVEGEGWGGVPSEAVAKTLHAVAGVLLPHLPDAPAAAIVVTHTNGPPVTLYERGPGGEYLVHLHASGPRWHLYVYEFAHELTHILSNYDRNAGADKPRRNQWLEESLCETASLFVLDRLSASWSQGSDSGDWGGRAGILRSFFETLVGEPHRQLPAGYGFAAWLAENEAGLRSDPYRRKQDDLIARRLLPLFERMPGGWGALRYLNLDATDNDATLRQFLAHWYGNAPLEHKPFVSTLLEVLEAGQAAANAGS
jgi:hypothetical protein